jgi:hypothetical protein
MNSTITKEELYKYMEKEANFRNELSSPRGEIYN